MVQDFKSCLILIALFMLQKFLGISLDFFQKLQAIFNVGKTLYEGNLFKLSRIRLLLFTGNFIQLINLSYQIIRCKD